MLVGFVSAVSVRRRICKGKEAVLGWGWGGGAGVGGAAWCWGCCSMHCAWVWPFEDSNSRLLRARVINPVPQGAVRRPCVVGRSACRRLKVPGPSSEIDIPRPVLGRSAARCGREPPPLGHNLGRQRTLGRRVEVRAGAEDKPDLAAVARPGQRVESRSLVKVDPVRTSVQRDVTPKVP